MAEPPGPTRKFSDALFGAQAPPAQLTAIECRLLAIAGDLIPRTALLLRNLEALANGVDLNGKLPPLSEEQVARVAKLSLVAAIELEQPLREMRDKLTKGT